MLVVLKSKQWLQNVQDGQNKVSLLLCFTERDHFLIEANLDNYHLDNYVHLGICVEQKYIASCKIT